VSGLCYPHHFINKALGVVVSDDRWADYRYLRDTKRMPPAEAKALILSGAPVERVSSKPAKSAGSAKAAADIVGYVGKRLRLPTDVILSPCRKSYIVRARACAVRIMVARNWGYEAVARHWGFRDHSSVVNMVKRWPEYVASEPRLQSIADGYAVAPVVAVPAAVIVQALPVPRVNNAGGFSMFRDIAA
jgi:hypothetical protein